MANLIITIISIALVAVAALMGAYYGGAAFLEGSRKAAATAIVNQAKQIDAAMKLHALSRGGVFTLSGGTNAYTPNFPDLVPAYLSSFPVAPREYMMSTGTGASFWDGHYNWGMINYPTFAFTVTTPNAAIIGFELTDDAYYVCREAHQIANGLTSGEGIPRSPPGYTWPALPLPGGVRTACFWRDTDNDGAYDSGEHGGTYLVHLYN